MRAIIEECLIEIRDGIGKISGCNPDPYFRTVGKMEVERVDGFQDLVTIKVSGKVIDKDGKVLMTTSRRALMFLLEQIGEGR